MGIRITIDDVRRAMPEAEIAGTMPGPITGVAAIDHAGPGDATFLDSAQHADKLRQTSAGLVFVPANLDEAPPEGRTYVYLKDPSLGLAKLCGLIEAIMRPLPQPGIHPRAYVDPAAKVASSASIGPHCTVGPESVIGERVVLESGVQIGRNVRIGDDCHLFQNCVVQDYCVLGNRVYLHPGVIIGGDGFGYIQTGQLPDLVHYKVPQIGNVVIEDDVEIGANATVDRARFGSTTVGEGTKIDNLVQIAHNVKIGRRCIICAHVGISGSTTIGDYVVIWGQAGLVGHIEVGNYAFIGAQAGVAKSLPDGAKVTGTPARPFLEVRKSEAALMRLPEMMSQIRKLIHGDSSQPSPGVKD
jgi:UDP-3-O-[3-hydroxymyristoyl] glucosamine N-acyltransferase